jgi:hypothetical protein
VNTIVTMISRRDQFRKCFKRAQSLLLQEVINEVDKELKKGTDLGEKLDQRKRSKRGQ